MTASLREESRLAGKHIIEDCWCDHTAPVHAWHNAAHDEKCAEDCDFQHVHIHCDRCSDQQPAWKCCEPPKTRS